MLISRLNRRFRAIRAPHSPSPDPEYRASMGNLTVGISAPDAMPGPRHSHPHCPNSAARHLVPISDEFIGSTVVTDR